MLPSSRRIPKDLYNTPGKFLNSVFFNFKISPVSPLNTTRFSFSVSKKVAQGAVMRNKIRRQGYSAIKKRITSVKKGYLLFFQAKKGVEKVGFEALSKDVELLLRKATLI